MKSPALNSPSLRNLSFGDDGAALFANALSPAQIKCLSDLLPGQRPGERLAERDDLAWLLNAEGPAGTIVDGLIGRPVIAVRAIAFDKTAEQNWSLGWHQDRTIVVRHRIDVEGYGPWSRKAGLLHVAPPISLLARMVTLRIHIDPVDLDNAPLLVAPGSHKLGLVTEGDIPSFVGDLGSVPCIADAGDIWAYATPILHASEASIRPSRRRVLQVDYSADALPGGLEWLGV